MENCDVVIIGGGPAGASCAWRLCRGGMKVLVLDKARFPRDKVCAGWITPAIIDELRIDPEEYQRARVFQVIHRFLTSVMGGREVETDYGCAVSYGIRRCEFDHFLLLRSKAEMRLGEAFRTLRREGTGWVVNDSFYAPLVIAAGGHFCPVARQLRSLVSGGLSQEGGDTGLPVVVAQEIEYEMPVKQRTICGFEPDRPELFFCPDLRGYGWVFRKGDYLNVGLGREGEDRLSTHVEAFVAYLRSRGKLPFELPQRFHGHAYRLRTKLPTMPEVDGALIIGDALGLADRQSGEGIRPAIESGLLAAMSILETGGHRGMLLGNYQEKLRNRFGDGNHASSSDGWLAGLRQFAARRLMNSRWFARHVLLDKWFLHADVPPLSVES